MKVNAQKLAALMRQPIRFPDAGESFRQQGVFFLSEGLPLQETMQSLFASDCESPVELFHFTFATPSSFAASLPLAHQVLKNFKGYRLGQFFYTPPAEHIDAAYAAGLELIDIPLFATGNQDQAERRRAALHHARTLFARWTVSLTLDSQESPRTLSRDLIDELLDSGILPLSLNPAASAGTSEEWLALYQLLTQRWRLSKANLRPIMPFLQLCTPLLANPPRTGMDKLLEVANAASQRATADLRRLLRVGGAEKSFDSAGL
jgi:hypothetical protein